MNLEDEITPDKDSFSFVEDVPEKGNPVSSSEFTCEVCGTDLVYSGRGRKPKRCDEHKRGKTTATATGRRASGAIVDRAVDEITMLYTMGGQALKFINPIAGETVFNNAEKLGESYRLLLETDARFRKMFQKMESKAAWLPILTMHAQIVASIWIASGVSKMEKLNSEATDASVF